MAAPQYLGFLSQERAWSEDESRLSFDARFDLCALQVTRRGYALSETACNKNHDLRTKFACEKSSPRPEAARLQKTFLLC